jgi:hypothetical protein
MYTETNLTESALRRYESRHALEPDTVNKRCSFGSDEFLNRPLSKYFVESMWFKVSMCQVLQQWSYGGREKDEAVLSTHVYDAIWTQPTRGMYYSNLDNVFDESSESMA